MSYGTDGNGEQTGYFIYDLWDIDAGLDGGHLTLANGTGTDIFCSSQLVLPQSGNVFLAGGDNWTGTGTTNTGNNNSNVLDPAQQRADARQQHEPRALVLQLDDAAERRDLHPGRLAAAPTGPKSAALDGTFRLLSGADTSTLDFMYPRNFVAPDGRVFGYDSSGPHVLRQPGGHRLDHQRRPVRFGATAAATRARRCSGPGRILQFGGDSNGAIVIDITGAHAGRDADAVDVVAAPARQRDDPAERQGARHRRQPGLEPAHRREQHRRDLGSARPARGRAAPIGAAPAPVPLDVAAAARRQRAGRRRRCAGPAEQLERGDLLPAVPVRRRPVRARRGRASTLGAGADRHRQDVHRRLHRCRRTSAASRWSRPAR